MSNLHLKKIIKVRINGLPKKSHKSYKILDMYSTIKTQSKNVGAHRRETRSEDKETSMAPGTSAGTTEPTLDLLTSPVVG